MVIHSSAKFSYNKETETFTADVSKLGPTPFGRVYPDTEDAGFVMFSKMTLREVIFAVDRTECDSEGDVIAWHLIPSRSTLRDYPQLRNIKVVVFND